jgi:N-acetylmuramoyl-L-alanine amidase
MGKLPKTFQTALVLSLVSGCFASTSTVSAATGTTFTKTSYQTTDALNLRSSNSTSSKKLLTIQKTTNVTSNYRKGSWYKLSYKGKTGYVTGSYLKKIESGTSFTKTSYKTTDALSLRSAATTSSNRLLTIPKGTGVQSSFKSGNWYKVTYANKIGYVSGSYLKKVAAPTKITVYRTTDRAYFRSSPSTSGKVLTTIPSGTAVSSLAVKSNWHTVQYQGKTGYVMGTYLKRGASVPAWTTGNVDHNGSKMYVLISSGNSVALRANTSTLSGQIARLGRGTPVVVTNPRHQTKGFVAVRTASGQSGYVDATYLTLFQPAPSNRPLLVLDPGHGGHDAGAVRYGVTECDIVLAVTKQVTERLAGKVDVTMSRYSNDYYPTLGERSALANSHATTAFVSVHINASTSEQAYGAETFYYKGASLINLAQNVQQRLVSYAGMRNRSVHYANYAVIRGTQAPSILAEIGFLSNSSDRPKLTNPTYQSRYAQAIADGILASL